MSKHIVAAARDIPPGARKVVSVKGRPIAIFNVGGEFFGVLNRCPHQGGPLAEGVLCGLVEASEPGQYRYSRTGEILRCPWHGWEFDIRTGQSWCDPRTLRVKAYEVTVESGAALVADPAVPSGGMVRGPYVAETYPVTLDGQYVVVEVTRRRSAPAAAAPGLRTDTARPGNSTGSSAQSAAPRR